MRAVLMLLLLMSPILSAETRGTLYVKEALPFLYQSVTKAIGKDRTDELFNGWSRAEFELVSEKLGALFQQINEGELKTKDRESLLRRYHRRILGTLGEAYGLRFLRAKYQGQPGVIVIDEITYAQENNSIFEKNNRPDGLAYSVMGNRVQIYDVIESKMGGGIKSAQIEGWFQRWKNNGLWVGGHQYSSDQIEIVLAGKISPLSKLKLRDIEEWVTWVTNQKNSAARFQIHPLSISREEGKRISVGVVGYSLSPKSRVMLRLSQFPNRLKQAAIERIKLALDSGSFNLPSRESPGPDQRGFASAIRRLFKGGTSGLYQALPPSYQKKMKAAGFDPANPRGSVRRMRGVATWSEDIVLAKVKQLLDTGTFNLPSRASPDADEKGFALAIKGYFRNLTGLYQGLPAGYQKKMKAAGFDPANPYGSAQRMHGTSKWSEDIVLERIRRALDAGTFKLPSSLSSDPDERSFAGAIKEHFGNLRSVYQALSPGYQRKLKAVGFDPANPIRSAKRMNGKAIWSEQIVLEKMKRLLDSGTFQLPSVTAADEDVRSFARAISRLFQGIKRLYEALPPGYQKKMKVAGFNPDNPIRSAKRMNGEAIWSEQIVLEKMKRLLDSGTFRLPSARSPDHEERTFGAAVPRLFEGGFAGLYEFLPAGYQNKMKAAGFDPANPKGSLRYLNGTAKWSEEVILEKIKRALDSGSFQLPSAASPSPDEKNFAVAIQRYFEGGLGGLYQALSPSYQKKMKAAGFDPVNPNLSARRMRRQAEGNGANGCKGILRGMG